MPTINQLIKNGRTKQTKKSMTPIMDQCPQKRGTLSIEYSITGIGSDNVVPLSVRFVVIVELPSLEVKQSQFLELLLPESILKISPKLPSQPAKAKSTKITRMIKILLFFTIILYHLTLEFVSGRDVESEPLVIVPPCFHPYRNLGIAQAQTYSKAVDIIDILSFEQIVICIFSCPASS